MWCTADEAVLGKILNFQEISPNFTYSQKIIILKV